MRVAKLHTNTLNRKTHSITDSILNHAGTYYYAQGKILIHLRYEYESDRGCDTPGAYLHYHRTFRGMATRELAEKIGVVPATITLYENDRHAIRYDTAVAIADTLGIDRSRLLDGYTAFIDYPCGDLLKKARTMAGMNQMQFSAEIGVAQSAYSRWERGAGNPRRQEYEKILAALDRLQLSMEELTDGGDASPIPAAM